MVESMASSNGCFMRYGRFALTAPVGSGPTGPHFLADATEGRFEVRSLERILQDREAWNALRFRLRLLDLLHHNSALQPAIVDLVHEPPYLALPAGEQSDVIQVSDKPLDFALDLVLLVRDAHRVGLTLGGIDRGAIRRTLSGGLVIDLTGTGQTGARMLPGESSTEDDIAFLGALLQEFLSDNDRPGETGSDRWPGWNTLVGIMRSRDPADRPLASEVAGWFEHDAIARQTPAVEVEAFRHKPATSASLEAGSGLSPDLEQTITPAEEIGALTVASTMPRTGDRVGRFVLLDKLGEGGMGIVYRANDPADGAVVAVKILKPEAARSETSRRRFVKEGHLLAKLNSPHVTKLIAIDTDDELCYLAVEYVPGMSLGEYLKSAGRVPEKPALEMIADAARGLAAAHRLGIVHRDIKPDNLLVLPDAMPGPRVKVTDFGLARMLVQSDSLDVTKSGSLLGTPRFMSPEQFGGKPVDARADVYSLGATLFNLLTGQVPFPQSNLMELTRAVVAEPAPLADRLNPEISSATADLVARCLSKEPSGRPADAGMFLREIERLISGDSADIMSHPRIPSASSRGVAYAHEWLLKATPTQLWPHVSNTERLNRAIGLPAVRYVIRRDPQLGTRRFAHAKILGFKMEWEEHPFEWVEGRRMGILREFVRGPFVWMLSVVELSTHPGGGALLRHTLQAEPRGLLGRIIAPLNLGKGAKRGLEAVYRRIDANIGHSAESRMEDPFEIPTRLPNSNQRRLQARLDRLSQGGCSPEAIDILGLFVANAPDQEVARIKPLALARRFGIDEAAMCETCLRSVGEGLLQLQWDVICPLCRIPSGHRDTLRDVREHENCPTCDVAFQTDFASAIELVFRVHPDVRPAEVGTYCAGGPAHSPHVVAQVRLAPGERVELELALSEGLYKVRGPQLPWNLELRVAAEAVTDRWEVNLESAGKESIPPVGVGGQVLVLNNGSNRELIVRIERTADRDDVLTAARATALPAFRELFPGELLSPGQLAPASAVTLLLAQVDQAEKMFKTLGEAMAFQVIQASFRDIEAKVKAGGGVIVKTVGEGILAAFTEVTNAVRTALTLVEVRGGESESAGTPLRVAVHRGMAMVATVNERLDYFGLTPRLLDRLLEIAGTDELAITATTTTDHDVRELFGNRVLKLSELIRPELSPALTYVVKMKKSKDV